MKFYSVGTLGDEHDASLCILDSPPEGIGLASRRPARGRRVGEDYPRNPVMRMSSLHPGLKLSTLLGNTLGYLIVQKVMKKIIKENTGEYNIEYLPFTLINHKNRTASTDYFIVNPIGTCDCLNKEASDLLWARKQAGTRILAVNEIVLDRTLAPKLPDLFRPRYAPTTYVFSERLISRLQGHGFTNVFLDELQLA